MIEHRADGHPVVNIPKAAYFAKLHCKLSKLGRFPKWVVIHPQNREYPGLWVARMHVALPEPKPTRFVMTSGTIGGLRAVLPDGLTWMNRHEDDAPEIIEVWL